MCGRNPFDHIFHILGNSYRYPYDILIFGTWTILVEQEYIFSSGSILYPNIIFLGIWGLKKIKDMRVCYDFILFVLLR